MKSIRRRVAGVLLGALVLLGTAIVTATPAGAVIGGTLSTADQYPYYVDVAAIRGPGTSCGGSVIAPGFVLTAAHCVDDGLTTDQVVVYTPGSNVHQVVYLYIHPLWNGNVEDGHDLAVLVMANGTTDGITPPQVGSPWDPSAYAGGHEATIVGRGNTSPFAPRDGQLYAADTPLRSDDAMEDIYNHWYFVDDWKPDLMIGAGSSGQTACRGDSGSPLLVVHGGRLVQVGVTSFSETENCNVPAAYAELSGAQLAWLAVVAPGVKAGWPACVDKHGNPGIPIASYSYQPWDPNDGPYNGQITCAIRDPSPIPTAPPTPSPDPTGPPVCTNLVRRCTNP